MGREPLQQGRLRRGLRVGMLEVTSHFESRARTDLYLGRATQPSGEICTVMVKQLRSAYGAGERELEAFLEEARIATSLNHRSVVRPLDVGEYEGSFFFTMEYVDGIDVSSLMQKAGRLPVKVALAIVAETARALHEIHKLRDGEGERLGIVHRNLSPDNVLISRAGDVKLIDFGHEQETREQIRRGEFSYLAPEQCFDEPVDARTDVFALGILLWELSTGARLFVGDDEQAVRQNICAKPIAHPSSRVADYPAVLEDIVMKALARNPRDRFSTAGELASALTDVARATGWAMPQIEISSYASRFIGQAPARAQKPAIHRTSRPEPRALVHSPSRPPAPSASRPNKGKARRSLLGSLLIALALIGTASVAAAFVLPSLARPTSQETAQKTKRPPQAVTSKNRAATEPAEKPAKKAPPALSVAAERPEESEPIPVDVDPIPLPEAKTARTTTRSKPRRTSRKRAPRTKSRVSKFKSDVVKRRRRSSAKPEKPPAKKRSTAAALLPSQR